MYDIAEAFERIENELISSMMRNMSKHISDEINEGLKYNQWQTEQLKALAEYRRHNAKKYGTQFVDINPKIDNAIRQAYSTGRMNEEIKIIEAIKNGFISPPSEFFATDKNKLDMLIKSVTNDFQKAEYAVLRRSDDIYRRIIFNSQVYLNSGAGTLQQAIDMASKDFLSSGINCIQYRDGRLVNISSYSEMALRTANKRAKLTAEGDERTKYGIHTVLVSSHNGACPLCVKWQGKVYIDDVYSSGVSDGKYPLLSTAIAGGLFHPNCQNGLSTFIEGVNTPPKPPSKEVEQEQIKNYNLQQKQRYNERQIRKYKRLSEYSLDAENKAKYTQKLKQWQGIQRKLISDNPDILRRQYDREKIYGGVTLNESRKNQLSKPITDVSINRIKAIDSKVYSSEQNEIIKEKHKELLRYARNNNPSGECAFILSSDFKKQVECLGKTSTLDFSSREAINMFAYERNLYVMHNHPKNSSFSMNDIRFFIEHETVKTLSIVKHNGVVLQLTKSEKYDSIKARKELKKSIIKYVSNGTSKELDKAIKDFINKKELFIYETT